jgi:hypothetical protein
LLKIFFNLSIHINNTSLELYSGSVIISNLTPILITYAVLILTASVNSLY